MVPKKKNTATGSLALSSRVTPSVENMEKKLSRPYREVLENWEHDYVEKANERWKENHRNFIKELLFQQDLLDSYKSVKNRRVNFKEQPTGSLVVNKKLSTIEESGTLGTITEPVEYVISGGIPASSVPIKKIVTYYGLVDDVNLSERTTYVTDDLLTQKQGGLVTVAPSGDYTYLDTYSKTGAALALAGRNSGLAGGRSDDVYEVLEENLVGDTDPFGIARQRKVVRDGAHAKEHHMVDLIIKDGSRYYPGGSNKVTALDLADAKGLSREALRNRVNKRTGAQQISYLYEGYGNSSNNYGSDYTYLLPGTYGNFLPGDYEFVVRQGDDEFPSTQSVRYLDLDLRGSRFSRSGVDGLRALPSPTKTSSLLTGTTLDESKSVRRKRYSAKATPDYALEKGDDKDYSYLDYLNFSSDSTSKSGSKKPLGSDFSRPFGLDAAELDPLSPDYFQTVSVDLRRHKLTQGGKDIYPRIVLPKKVFMDDIVVRSPNFGGDGLRRSRLSGSGGWVTIGDNTKRYQVHRSSSLDDFLDEGRPRRYATVPGMATHLAGAIVNDALDRLFGYGPQKPVVGYGSYIRVRSRSPSPPPPPPLTLHKPPSRHYRPVDMGDSFKSRRDDERRKRKELQDEFERDEKERERRKKDREADRQRQLRKMEDDYEKEKRDRERRQDDRRREREQEKKRRELEWEQQQAEWDRQKRQRDREREQLRQERERLDEEARQKAKLKFDPRVHTVITDDAPPKADSGVKATPHEVVHPVAEAKSPSDPPPQRKKMLAEAAEHDPGEVRNQQMGHWEGHGYFKDERVIFNSDEGYIHWTKPKGSLEVIFKSPEGHLDFSCKVEPKHEGMKIYEVREDAEVLISNGRGPGSLETLEFSAIDGVVVIVLETYEEEEQLPPEFKMVWGLHM